MAKPNFQKTLSEVLGYSSKMTEKTSAKGTTYQAEVIEEITVIAAGEPERQERNGIVSYKYPIFDQKTDLNYEIRVNGEKPADVSFGNKLKFVTLTGGSLNGGGYWFAAENVHKLVKAPA